MKSLSEKMRTYRLPETTTSENLGCAWSTVVDFGNRVLLAGYFYSGPKANSYFAAVYEHTKTCEGEIRLTAVSDELFPDNGRALQWAMTH